MKKIFTLAALTAAILTTNIPAFATADLPDLRISDSGQQIVEEQPVAPEQTNEQRPHRLKTYRLTTQSQTHRRVSVTRSLTSTSINQPMRTARLLEHTKKENL